MNKLDKQNKKQSQGLFNWSSKMRSVQNDKGQTDSRRCQACHGAWRKWVSTKMMTHNKNTSTQKMSSIK